jgi:hypothetical protein
MSQTETHFGKLRKVVFDEGQTLEQWCEAKCKELDVHKLSSYNKTWYEELRGEGQEKYFFVKEEIWEAFDHKEFDDSDDIDVLTENEDGTLTFIQQFYNGGTCLSECLEEALERLNKNKS